MESTGHSLAMLVEHDRRLVCRQHMQEDRLHQQPVAARQVPNQRVQQQRSYAVSPMRLVHAQRQNVRHLGALVRARLRQNVAVLLVHAHERLDLGHNQTDDGQIVNGGQRIEARTGRDVNVPGQRIVNGEPVLAQRAHLFQVVRTEEAQLDVGRRAQRHHIVGVRTAAGRHRGGRRRIGFPVAILQRVPDARERGNDWRGLEMANCAATAFIEFAIVYGIDSAIGAIILGNHTHTNETHSRTRRSHKLVAVVVVAVAHHI